MSEREEPKAPEVSAEKPEQLSFFSSLGEAKFERLMKEQVEGLKLRVEFDPFEKLVYCQILRLHSPPHGVLAIGRGATMLQALERAIELAKDK